MVEFKNIFKDKPTLEAYLKLLVKQGFIKLEVFAQNRNHPRKQ